MTTFKNYLDTDSTVLNTIRPQHLVGEGVKPLIVVDDLGIAEQLFHHVTGHGFGDQTLFVWINREGYHRKKPLIRNASIVVTNEARLIADRMLVRPTIIIEFNKSTLTTKLLKHPKI